jgi:hypothetical protein
MFVGLAGITFQAFLSSAFSFIQLLLIKKCCPITKTALILVKCYGWVDNRALFSLLRETFTLERYRERSALGTVFQVLR